MRVGIGYDVHALVKGRKLFLGGIEIPSDKGLLGHSDGDCLIHAICDALLGAISEQDIGFHFPNTDETIKGISSIKILEYVSGLVKNKGYSIINIDAIVVAESPKVYPYRDRIKEQLAKILHIEKDCIGIKGKTTEGLGFTGRREGIAVYAVALVEKEPQKWQEATGELNFMG
ncbi:MAG TPA: 2-C-methyl-D-erythritol 2,4-cyclodiphosphate synthase [Syntrophorhabdaceae bacterium]|nr:2-C-methyl-D-erythritol 2,4-cyclodiphosphate synthase [Syntrophorhabdaceae bacterium]